MKSYLEEGFVEREDGEEVFLLADEDEDGCSSLANDYSAVEMESGRSC